MAQCTMEYYTDVLIKRVFPPMAIMEKLVLPHKQLKGGLKQLFYGI